MKRRFKILVIALLLIFGGWGIVRGNFWTVKEIRCSLNEKTCSPQLWENLLTASLGKNFLFLSESAITGPLVLNYPEIDKIEIRRVLPAELAFKLTTSSVQAAIKGEKYFLVNEAGVVLKISDQSGDLPVILMDSVKEVGVGEKFTQKELVPAIMILAALAARKLPPTMAKILPPRLEVWLSNGLLVVFSLEKDADLPLDSLQVIFARVKMEGRVLTKVDLRFAKPVVVYE